MTVHVAILGPGQIADRMLAPALRRVPGARLWSVLGRDAERARAFAERHGAAAPRPAHTDLETLLADPELHAVVIATPDALHAPQALAAARAGKHVLVEKPLATSVADARAVVDACRASDVRLGVAYHLRWHSGHRALSAQVRNGALGELRHARAQWTYRAEDASNWRARTEMGRWWALAGVGTHLVDLVRWMMMPTCGEVVEARSLVTRSVFRGENDETALLLLRFASGATAEICCSVLFDSTPVLELYGATASATCEGTLGAHGKGRIRLRGAELEFAPADPYVGELADFVLAVRAGGAPEVDGVEGLRNVEILCEADPR